MADVVMAESSSAALTRREHLLKTFEGYRAEFDADNERRERLIITSRTITQLSKKLIFHLHRGATAPSQSIRLKNIREGKAKEREIHTHFIKIRDELAGERSETFWRWSRQVSPGLEEYIEGLSFLHYLDKGDLITLEEIQTTLSDEETGEPLVIVTPDDYILGTSDLTGELMRYATNALSTGDHETPLSVCDFVRTVKIHFDGITPQMLRKLKQKQEETTRSLEKIEKVCYAIRLRLVEYADRPDILKQLAKRALDDSRNAGPPADE